MPCNLFNGGYIFSLSGDYTPHDCLDPVAGLDTPGIEVVQSYRKTEEDVRTALVADLIKLISFRKWLCMLLGDCR